MPNLSYKGYDPISISIARPDAPEEDLYVMSAGPWPCPGAFQVLTFGRPTSPQVFPKPTREVWQWETLQPPPLPESCLICSHAVLRDGRTICITAAKYSGGAATYLFDTVKREWTQAPDGWDLPFFCGAEYVPDLKLWVGLATADDGFHNDLCASDLSVPVDKGKAPTLNHQWDVVKTPEEWQTVRGAILNLGDGRFCIFRLIHDLFVKNGYDDDFPYQGNLRQLLALLTGVEISSSPEHGIRMVPHKSLNYVFNKDSIKCVL
ncbi:unnamed protein product [Urochloa humidicola]